MSDIVERLRGIMETCENCGPDAGATIQPSAAPRFTCLASVGPDLRGCGLVFGSWDELKAHEETHQPPAVQPERCCVDYPRCDCNSPPEPAQEPKGCNHFPGQVNCEWCTEVPHE